MTKQQPKVPASDQTLRILLLLARSRGPLPASVIAAQLGIPRSTTYHLLATLLEHDFVMHLPEERRYGLGIAAVELSSAYGRQEPLARLGRPLIATLVEQLGMSGHLAVPLGRDVLYIIEERYPGTPSLVTDVNVRLPMPATASGRAILSQLPKAQARALFPNAESFVSAHTREYPITKYSELRSVLDETVTRGYAVERGSVTEGISSVAASVVDHRGWPIAAVAVTFADRDHGTDEYPRLAAEVIETAATLSARIHGRTPAAQPVTD
ncbi:IclR family transcriptional regulator [Leucobacter sp. UCMA 4100]|uniref:IclR family transcriptional regulator n=1 Tax=Leucobacter sp. UCMA 4100 TaxID=2810534 RepID=UPI0022EB864B|nr:IclR family transcriptional regulator [Leucobacter sp. UCMA 4100]MDA3147722.1 IclR family transcriptional regulator [Leucobacter sp. UCMA 4100]